MGWCCMDHVKKVAVLFAGQGTQFPHMGLTTLKESPELIPYFNTLSTSLNFDLTDVLKGEDGRLNQTRYTQPSLAVTSLLLYRQLREQVAFVPSMVAGFSLGEITALVASGWLDEASMLQLLNVRANAMEQASLAHPGKMAAILGATDEQIQALLSAVKQNDVLEIVNYNCPGQRVISGSIDAIDRAVAQASAFGARRALPLNVSGAFHSSLMRGTQSALDAVLTTLPFQQPTIPQLMNQTAKVATMPTIRERLSEQVFSPVLFETTIQNMINEGVQTFLEIGPGSVLTAFVKKIDPTVRVASYNGLSDIPTIKELLQ